MKQKIKIMRNRPQPSDEEIQSYMNFDRLLSDRKMALHVSRTTLILKWVAPILLITVGIVAFLRMTNNSRTPIEAEREAQESVVNPQKITPSFPLDSATEKTEGVEIEKDESKTISPEKVHEATTERSPIKGEVDAELKESGYVQAEPVNGYSLLYEYFNENLVYPAEALQDSIQGVQTISFVINVHGEAEQIEIVESLGEPFERECRRLIEDMPEWKPATLNGKPVASRISLPLTFQIHKIKD